MDRLHLQGRLATRSCRKGTRRSQGTHATEPRWPTAAREQRVLRQTALARDCSGPEEAIFSDWTKKDADSEQNAGARSTTTLLHQ